MVYDKKQYEDFVNEWFYPAILVETGEMGTARKSKDYPWLCDWYPDEKECNSHDFPWNRIRSGISADKMEFIGNRTTLKEEMEKAIDKALEPLKNTLQCV